MDEAVIQSAELVVRELTEIVTNKGSNIPRLCRVGEFLLSFNWVFFCFFLLLFKSGIFLFVFYYYLGRRVRRVREREEVRVWVRKLQGGQSLEMRLFRTFEYSHICTALAKICKLGWIRRTKWQKSTKLNVKRGINQ